jgi:type IV secretion system protein VirB10
MAAVLAVGLFCSQELLAQKISVPAGTVVDLRMDTGLNSGTSRVNDAFSATVIRSVWLDGQIAIPRDSKVDGRVSMVQPAMRGSKSGVIAVSFTQITIDGRRYAINGTLTSVRDSERRQILEQEGSVQGSSSAVRNTVFIGGGAGAGAAVGAIAGGGKGAGAGAAIGGGLGILGALLSNGSEAKVPAGSEMAMELLRSVTVTVINSGPSRQRRGDDRELYVAANLVTGAQNTLRQLRYYSGPVNGRLDTPTRRAIAHFQIDNYMQGTGDLDHETAVELGLVRSQHPGRSGGQNGRGNSGGYGR